MTGANVTAQYVVRPSVNSELMTNFVGTVVMETITFQN